MSELHRDPLSAWNYLCDQGGIELEDRDEGLDIEILKHLNPIFPMSLQAALASATMEAFTQAFFKAFASPFVAMFRGILDFFEKAGATKGQDQWRLRLDDVDVTLEDFREWLTKWSDAVQVTVQVPAIDSRGLADLHQLLWSRKEIKEAVQRAFKKTSLSLPSDVQAWVADYNDGGQYRALPQSLLPPECPSGLVTSASIAQAMLSELSRLELSRDQFLLTYRQHGYKPNRDDAFDIWTIAQNETDYYLRTLIVSLSAAATYLSNEELENLGRDLSHILSRYPLRPFEATISLADLESVLSLPIWKKRNELYSVWIATEIIRALEGHEIELHHDKGLMDFAFRRTLIATIHTSPGPFTLISERRSPLQDPQGKGRTEGVQPDHGLWTKVNGKEICRMVIEVKHYKKWRKSDWIDIFEDYANAFPAGQVYLVNHGPRGPAVENLSDAIADRCHAIGQLTPFNLEARKKLAQAVRVCVGDPTIRWPDTTGEIEASTVLVLDVSGSMRQQLRSAAMEAFVKNLIATERPAKLVAVDEAIVGSWSATEAGFSELLQLGGGSTDPEESMRLLLKDYKTVVVITDDDGESMIHTLSPEIHQAQTSAPQYVRVVVCKGRSSST